MWVKIHPQKSSQYWLMQVGGLLRGRFTIWMTFWSSGSLGTDEERKTCINLAVGVQLAGVSNTVRRKWKDL